MEVTRLSYVKFIITSHIGWIKSKLQYFQNYFHFKEIHIHKILFLNSIQEEQKITCII
jgi:hypothetical protein